MLQGVCWCFIGESVLVLEVQVCWCVTGESVWVSQVSVLVCSM